MEFNKLTYRFVLGLFSIAIVGAVINSIINYDSIVITFKKLGYPIYLIHLLGFAQITGLALILLNKDNKILEWVYAGFFMNFTLGAIAHIAVKDGNGASAVVCLILLFVTYLQTKKNREDAQQSKTLDTVNI